MQIEIIIKDDYGNNICSMEDKNVEKDEEEYCHTVLNDLIENYQNNVGKCDICLNEVIFSRINQKDHIHICNYCKNNE